MKSFDEWFSEQKPEEPELPEGIWEIDGKYYCECCCCGRTINIHEEIGIDIYDEDFTEIYGNCGPHCIP